MAVAEFTRYCTELLSSLGPVRTRRMFGGWGIYVDDLFMALIASEQLYLKADALTRAQFEAAGCEPFRYATREGEQVSMSFFRPPEEAMESAPLMLPWARLALAAALRAQVAKEAKSAASAKSRKPVKPRATATAKMKKAGTSSKKA